MELTPKQQVIEMLKEKNSFLILTHSNPDGDAIGSAIALNLTLNKLSKKSTIACVDAISSVFNFLPASDQFKTEFSGKREFVISVDTSATKADKIMYKVEGDVLNIIITPRDGQFTEGNVKFGEGKYHFDAIIVLDCPSLERLGEIYEKNAPLFYEIPVINIDHHPANDHFGKINLVDITATSTSEVLVSLIESLTGDPKFFDENIATALLCGIITDTNSFQNTNTTPKSLTVAAQLVAANAHQQEIIKHIYKTKPLSTLRLWGRALTNLHDEKEYRFVWSSISKKDYLEVGASPDESSGLIDELLKTASGTDFALLLSEKNGDVCGSLRSSNKATDVSEIAKLFNGGGHSAASGFEIKNSSLLQSSENILQKIKNHQREREKISQ